MRQKISSGFQNELKKQIKTKKETMKKQRLHFYDELLPA